MEEIAGMSTTDILPDVDFGEFGGLGKTNWLFLELDTTDLVIAINSRMVLAAVVWKVKFFTKQLTVKRT